MMQTLGQMSGMFGRRKGCKPVCLFGVPDPVETEKIYEEAMMVARENFINTWNFDVFRMEPSTRADGLRWEAVGYSDNTRVAPPPVDDGPGAGRLAAEVEPTPVASRRSRGVRLSPYDKQQKLTDFWRNCKSPSRAHISRSSKIFEDRLVLAGHQPSSERSASESGNT